MSSVLQGPRRPPRRAGLVAAGMFAAAILSAATAATAAPATVAVRSLTQPSRLNYAADPGQHLAQLESGFVAQQLGLPPSGDLARLLTVSSLGGPPGPTSAPRGTVVRSRTYPCVNGRQTADPLSPPCVVDFAGDNGGSTYQGVTADEIRLLVVIAPAAQFNATRRPPWGSYYDLAAPPVTDERTDLVYLNRLRLYQAYFNRHFQTFGRRVHFIVYSYNQLGADTDAACRAIAAENDSLVHPFATFLAGSGDEVPLCYGQEMAARGVPTFFSDRQIETTETKSGLLWGLPPDTERAAQLFTSYVCQKVARRPVVLSGNPLENGKPRKVGLLYGDLPEYARFAKAVRTTIERCGTDIVDVEPIEEPLGTCSEFFGAASESTSGYPVRDVTEALARFMAKGVTTVIWPGCSDTRVNAVAGSIKYFPEWVLWGAGGLDVALEASYPSAFGSPAFDAWTKHAVVVSSATFKPELRERLCFDALREIDQDVDDSSVTWESCEYYDGLRQVFSAIQLAGPQLTPQSMDRGVRRVSYSRSGPQIPRCGYPMGDYSCVKDAQVDWWDRSGDSQPAGGAGPTRYRTGGCWRAMESGRRYPAGQWPPGNIDAQLRDGPLPDHGDPCTYHGSYPIP